jgi:hypothetical protein
VEINKCNFNNRVVNSSNNSNNNNFNNQEINKYQV